MPETTPTIVGLRLEEIASAKKSIFYGELVAEFGLPPLDGAWSSHPLSGIFGILDREDALAKRPLRTAVVISKENNYPGNGFFVALEELKGIKAHNENRKIEVWLSEFKAAHAYQWGS